MSDNLDELIARLEAAIEGSAELGGMVLCAVRGWRFVDAKEEGGLLVVKCAPASVEGWVGFPGNPTTSIDAALTLVPETMPVDLHIGPRGMGNDAVVHQPIRYTDDQGRRCTRFEQHGCTAVRGGVIHWTPAPIALCVAALKARARDVSTTDLGNTRR